MIETIVSMALLIVVLTAGLVMVEVVLRTSATTRGREGATNLAREILEAAHAIPFGQMSPSSLTGQLQAVHGLADGSAAAGWQVVRRGLTYTVTASSCSIDDPADGFGVHDATFCPDSSATGVADPQPADLKRLTVDVSWTIGPNTRDVQQVQTISSAGQALGPSTGGLGLSVPAVSAPTAPVVTDPAVTQLTFTVTTPATANTVNWTLDGSVQSPAATGTGTSRTFSWPIAGRSDGTYQVGAQAVDPTGVAGAPMSISVTLLRSVPAAPAAIAGGPNTVGVNGARTQVTELQWQANTERNLIGYRVYNPLGALLCPGSPGTLSLVTSCVTTNLVGTSASVVALYRNAQGAVAQGAAGTVVLPLLATPPNAPTSLTAVAQSDGTVLLSWTRPASGAPVAFYRVYRDGADYTARYDYTGAATPTTYSDARTFASVHNYYVTAVNASLAESPMVGPVHP